MKIITGKFIVILFAGIFSTLFIIGCKKNYLTGGTLHDPVTSLNNIDYLKGNSFGLFDTAVRIIERLGLTNEVNNAKTFFAFTDYSVAKTISAKLAEKQLINPLAAYTLDSLVKDINEDSVRQYMFKEALELTSAPELKASPYTSLGKTNMGILKQLQTGSPYTNMTKAPTYLLFLVKVRGALDEPGVISPSSEIDISVLCQTTGIKTSNGNTTLHVLNNNHTFVRF